MQNIFKDFGLFLIAITMGLAGCSVPITKQLAQHNSFMGGPSFGIGSQFINEEKMTLSLTIPLK